VGPEGLHLLLAKATGNFKRGNERSANQGPGIPE
jgi:hypothetical protein